MLGRGELVESGELALVHLKLLVVGLEIFVESGERGFIEDLDLLLEELALLGLECVMESAL